MTTNHWLKICSQFIIYTVLFVRCSSGNMTLTPDAAMDDASTAANDPENVPILLFDIGLHIEPYGAEISGLSTDTANLTRASKQDASDKKQNSSEKVKDYHDAEFFDKQIGFIKDIVGIVQNHGGRMTIQAQSPFTTEIQKTNSPYSSLLADYEKAGHEIGLHFHEDAHLGENPENLSADVWCEVIKQEIGFIRDTGVHTIQYYSGGNTYQHMMSAASCAGLKYNSDWKNRKTQASSFQLMGTSPWRPSGGVTIASSISEYDDSFFAQHDNNGAIIFLPEGIYPRDDYASSRHQEDMSFEEYFEMIKASFLDTLSKSRPDHVNVFHFTVHPGDFHGDHKDPFVVIDKFLTEVVDPEVVAGRVQWATFSQMAQAYEEWEKLHADEDPREGDSIPDGQADCSDCIDEADPYMTFAINVHDIGHVQESVMTINRAVDIFQKYGVKGEFYITAPMIDLFQAYADLYESDPAQDPNFDQERFPNYDSNIIRRLKSSGMGISYHVRPPHPLYHGFDDEFAALKKDEGELKAAVLAYETGKLDLQTGNLNSTESGGYSAVAGAFGINPTTIGLQSDDESIKSLAETVFAELGAKMVVHCHEDCIDLENPPENPFTWVNGLLERPVDMNVTRWTTNEVSKSTFWWNMLNGKYADAYDPTEKLESLITSWKGVRAPFIVSQIHENNFYRSGSESWTCVYYSCTGNSSDKDSPLSPPYLIDPDPLNLIENGLDQDISTARSEEEQEAIWQAYEDMVAYAAEHLRVVTAQDIVDLAETEIESSDSFDSSFLGTTQKDIQFCEADGETLKLDLYYPDQSLWQGSAPVVVDIHGGGWGVASGLNDKSSLQSGSDATYKDSLVQAGFIVAAINYRLSPEYKFPAHIEDVKCAVRFLRDNAGQYGVEKNHIGVLGNSAGGHLAALLGTTDKNSGFEGTGKSSKTSSRVQAVVDLYGPADLTMALDSDFPGMGLSYQSKVFGVGSGLSDEEKREILQNASPVTYATADDPPFLIVHGMDDDLVPIEQSYRMQEALLAVGVSAELVEVKNAVHGLRQNCSISGTAQKSKKKGSNCTGEVSPSIDEIAQQITIFFNDNLKQATNLKEVP